MTIEEIKKNKENETEVSVRKTCPKCHERKRVRPDRVTCPDCGGSYYGGVKSPTPKKSKDVKIDKSEQTEAGDGATLKASVGVGEGKVSERKVKEIPQDVLGKHFFIQSKRGAEAEAIVTKYGIQVLKNSATASDWVTSIPEAVKEKGEQLRKEGIIINNQFVQDYTFKSPSMAAAIVQGRSANGLRDWKNKDGKSLKEVMK